jgi:hypothetical protein
MDLKYKKVMEENGLTYADLPEDAQTGIESINEVLKAFRMNEKNGKSPTPKSLKKLAAMDKWVVYEIYDYLHDTDNNDDDIPFEADDVLGDDDANKNKGNNTPKPNENDDNSNNVDPIGVKIDEELLQLHGEGVKTITVERLNSKAPTTYKTIWDNYEDGVENGVETSHFSLIEQGNTKVFTLKKL